MKAEYYFAIDEAARELIGQAFARLEASIRSAPDGHAIAAFESELAAIDQAHQIAHSVLKA